MVRKGSPVRVRQRASFVIDSARGWYRHSAWQEFERADVPRAQRGEVTVVERGEAPLAEPLDACQHGRIDKAETVVGITVEQRRDAQQVSRRGVEHLERASGDVLQQSVERARPGR